MHSVPFRFAFNMDLLFTLVLCMLVLYGTPGATTEKRAASCGEDEIQCRVGGPCLPRSLRCDGVQDCSNGEDERGCGCVDADKFQCRDGSCIYESWVCDFDNSCAGPGEEDELDCLNTPCRGGRYKCPNGQCIPSLRLCDRRNDCPGGEDEQDCNLIPAEEVVCEKEMFKCTVSGRCIPSVWVCDGDRDCSDGEDEKHCVESGTTPYVVQEDVEYCSGYVDGDGIWNNGFFCPRWGEQTRSYCCGTDQNRFCCPPPEDA